MNTSSYHVIPRKDKWIIRRSIDVLAPLSSFDHPLDAISSALEICKRNRAKLYIHWPREGIIYKSQTL